MSLSPIEQMDSKSFNILAEDIGFREAFSWNYRGHIATWKIIDNKLCLEKIWSISEGDVSFREAMRSYTDNKGHVYASWFSGTIICGTGPVLWYSRDGWSDLYETEVKLTIESGVVKLSRKYRNKVHSGLQDTKDNLTIISEQFDFGSFPELAGKRVAVQIAPSRFGKDGRILDWTVAVLKWPEHAEESVRERLIVALKEELLKKDWTTYCADNEWFWRDRNNEFRIVWGIDFKPEYYQKALADRTLELCQYIPDHVLNPDAKEAMTPEFFHALSEVFEAPVADYLEIGDNEWLWYFVTGNGGGEARLAELYLVLHGDAPFYILDEPFTQVDPVNIEDVKAMIRERTKDNGIIITDHNYDAISSVADDLFVIADGYTNQVRSREDLVRHGYLRAEG